MQPERAVCERRAVMRVLHSAKNGPQGQSSRAPGRKLGALPLYAIGMNPLLRTLS